MAGAVGGAHSAAAAPRPAGSPPIGGWAALRLVHSVPEPEAACPPRTEAASAGCHTQRIDLRRTGNSWAWTGTPYTSMGLPCHEAFDCRIWRRGTAKPVLIAAMAPGTGPAAQAGVGAALAASALLNILEEDMAGYLKSGRLATLLRGAAGEVQLVLERQAHPARRSIGDYATALLAVVLTDNGSVIGQIGGGAALVQGQDGAWCPVRWSGEAGTANKARYLTDADAFTAFQISELPSAPRRVFVFFQQA
ncbi:MAG: protein phosphatase 2C domain-containing protein [Rhodomicrobium sp.]